MSTSEFQDPETSRAWQRAVSEELVEGFGEIVVEFFDEGRSRRWSWWDRPAAAALLAAAVSPDREFDAVVVGEYERAFHGDQFRQVVARLTAAGVRVWLPEAGGLVELDSPVHQALMVLLGAQAQREMARARQTGVGGDAGPDPVAGPFPRGPSTVWVSPGGWWAGAGRSTQARANWAKLCHVRQPVSRALAATVARSSQCCAGDEVSRPLACRGLSAGTAGEESGCRWAERDESDAPVGQVR